MSDTLAINDVSLDHNPYVLASRAEVNSPDSDSSHGALFLLRCQSTANEVDAQALLEAIREVEAEGDEFAEHHVYDAFDTEVTDGADSAGSIYTYQAWREFTDLCLWDEDVTELGEVRADHLTEDVAMRATYLVARRLIPALVVERAVALLEANPVEDEVVESPSGWSYRSSQENGDQVDCQGCGDPLNDDLPIVNDEEGYAFHEGCQD